MSERSLAMVEMLYKENKKREPARLDGFKPFGLLTLFSEYVKSASPEKLKDLDRKRYTKIARSKAVGCAVFVDIEYGPFGYGGNTYDTAKHVVEHQRLPEHAATTKTRMAFVVPPGAVRGLFLIEKEGRSSGGSEVVSHFKDALLSDFPDHFYPTETVFEAESWRRVADLSKVSVTAKKWRSDIASDGGLSTVTVPAGTLRQSLEPEGGTKFFPKWFRDKVLDKTFNAPEYFGLGDEDDVVVEVVLEKDGSQKKFTVDKQRTPPLRVLLSEEGRPAMNDNEFVSAVFKEAKDYFQGNGYTWETKWESVRFEGVDSDGVWDHPHK